MKIEDERTIGSFLGSYNVGDVIDTKTDGDMRMVIKIGKENDSDFGYSVFYGFLNLRTGIAPVFYPSLKKLYESERQAGEERVNAHVTLLDGPKEAE